MTFHIMPINEVIHRAADFLEQYAEYIREVMPADLERHPYLPELEDVAQKLRYISTRAAALRKATTE